MHSDPDKLSKGGEFSFARFAWALLGISLSIVPALYGLSLVTVSSTRSPKLHVHDGARALAEPASEQPKTDTPREQQQAAPPLEARPSVDMCQGIARPMAHGLPTVPPLGATPRLFDVTAMPDRNATCPHCKGPLDILFCCGVCVLEHRFCEQKWPGKGVSARVLKVLLKKGFPLGDLTPCELFLRIRGRTLWFMGDSQTWHFYLAVECFLHEFAVDFVRRNVTDDPEKRLLLRPVTVTKERYSLCLYLVENTRVCVIRADDGWVMARDIFPTLRTLGDLTRDIMVYNFGLHFPPAESVLGAQLAHVADYVQANRSWLPHMVWMDTPPQHFRSDSGIFSAQALRKGCPPLKNNTIVQQGGLYNILARPYLDRLGEAHLEIWAATVPFFYTHLNPDCTHFCSPGPYQLWAFLLNGLLRDRGLGNAVGLPGQQLQGALEGQQLQGGLEGQQGAEQRQQPQQGEEGRGQLVGTGGVDTAEQFRKEQ